MFQSIKVLRFDGKPKTRHYGPKRNRRNKQATSKLKRNLLTQ